PPSPFRCRKPDGGISGCAVMQPMTLRRGARSRRSRLVGCYVCRCGRLSACSTAQVSPRREARCCRLGAGEPAAERREQMGTIMTDEERQAWLAIRKEAGLKIDPETAEVEWLYAQTLDPYGVYPELPEECQQVGREYFACSPGSDVWVNFGDLPEATRDALWKKHRSKLAFPAGLEALLTADRGR